jgi:hypothetical protein
MSKNRLQLCGQLRRLAAERLGQFHEKPRRHLAARRLQQRGHGLAQFPHALVLARHERHDRHAQRLAQRSSVNLVAVLAGDVHHVEREDRGIAQLDDLRGEIEVALEVRRVHDHDHGLRRWHFSDAVEQHVTRDLLVERLRAERVGARQVEDFDRDVRRRAEQAAFLALDGHARVVAHTRAQAGQRVEQRGLAAIGIAGQDDVAGRSRGGHFFVTRICSASCFRSERW